MKLFLASKASVTLDLVKPLLSNVPSKLTIAFIPTAANIYEDKPWMYEDRNKLMKMGFQVTDYDIAGKDEQTLQRDLSKFDILFMSAGNSYYLLKVLRETGSDKVIKELVERGKLYIGSSAGSVVLGPDLKHATELDHADWVPELKDYTALGIIPERIAPHYGNPKYAERYHKIIDMWGDQVTLLSDEQAIMINGDIRQIVETHSD